MTLCRSRPGRERAQQSRAEDPDDGPRDWGSLGRDRRPAGWGSPDRGGTCRSEGRHDGPPGRTPAGDEISGRSEEHTSELQSLMRISYAVFCLKKKKTLNTIT